MCTLLMGITLRAYYELLIILISQILWHCNFLLLYSFYLPSAICSRFIHVFDDHLPGMYNQNYNP